MGPRQSKPQQEGQQNQQAQMTLEQLAALYESRFSQAPTVDETLRQQHQDQQEKQQNVQTQDLPQQQKVEEQKTQQPQGSQQEFQMQKKEQIQQRDQSDEDDDKPLLQQIDRNISPDEGIYQAMPESIDNNNKMPVQRTENQFEEVSEQKPWIQKYEQPPEQIITKHEQQEKQPIQKFTQEQLMNDWLSTLFEIDIQKGTFLSNQVDLSSIFSKETILLTIFSLCDEVILEILSSENLFKTNQTKVDWLIAALGKLSFCFDIQQNKTILIKISGQTLETTSEELRQLTNSCCSFLTTLVLFPMTFNIQGIHEENPFQIGQSQMQLFQMVVQDPPSNQLADTLYYSLFRRDQLLQNDATLHTYLDFLDKEVGKDERITIIELMLKRVRKDCQVTLQDQSSLLNALATLDSLVDYPNILNSLMKESIAFYHPTIAKTGRELQFNTIIGRILSLSSFPKDTQEWRSYFTSILSFLILHILVKYPQKMVPENQINMVRDKIRKVLDSLFNLFQKIAKKKNMRDNVLQYFSNALQLNLNREKIFNLQLQALCSSPGFINNLLYILLKFCYPFLGNLQMSKEKAALIDPNLISYLKKHPLLSKLYAQTDLLNPALTPLQEPDEFSLSPHFITTIWLLTMKALHFHIPTITEYFKYLEEIHKLYTKGQEDKMVQLIPIKAAYDVALLDRQSINLTIRFVAFQCQVPMALLDETDEGQQETIQQEESKQAISLFGQDVKARYPYGVLPVTFLEDIHEVLSVYINTNSPALNENLPIFQLCAEYITITLNNRKLVSNPHLRVKGIETLAMFVPHKTNPRQRESNLHLIFSQSKIIEKNLIQALIKVFVDAEKTGTHNQFYDKFKYRFYFCKIFNYLVQNLGKVYSSYLERMSNTDKETFLEFANFYLNDMIFLLDECLGKMKEMKKMEEEDVTQLSEMEQMNRSNQYKEYKQVLMNFSFYLHEYYKNIQIISESEPQAFMTEEIREKLVNNMNYTVQQLNDDNSLQYKTIAMKEVNFQPKFIMGNVIELYINFSNDQRFIEQIVKDQRSFSVKLFEKTAQTLLKHNIITEEKSEVFTIMMEKLEKMLQEKQRFDEVNVPEEFLDPILGEIMRDPVKLPISNTVIDRITIKKHLLNDKSDPFNRTPLTEDMFIEMPELKEKIEKFIQDNMTKNQQPTQKE